MKPLVIILLLLGATSVAPCQSVLQVPVEYLTIQEAVAEAQNGDTVLVGPGTYTGQFTFEGKAITITSSHGPEATTLLAVGTGPVVRMQNGEGPESVLCGFTITGGLATLGETDGAGVYCCDSSPTIIGNIVTGNFAGHWGGGIHAKGAAPGEAFGARIIGNVIHDNEAQSGGGIFVRVMPAIVEDNIIFDNAVFQDLFVFPTCAGGGIALWGANGSIVRNNLIYNNTAFCESSGRGGGLYLDVIGGEYEFNTITGNMARSGGGITEFSSVVDMSEFIIFGNDALIDDQIERLGVGLLSITYSCVEDGYVGDGNISDDPDFMTGIGGPFYLSATSPCVDVGEPGVPPPDGTTSVDGFPDGEPADMGFHYPVHIHFFRRGDVNNDSSVDVSDAIAGLSWLFTPSAAAPFCDDAADVNDDGGMDIGDPVYLLTALFVPGSPSIPSPSPNCGADPTDGDTLDCPVTGACP